MCLHQKLACACKRNKAYLFHRDNILPERVVINLYCPECGSRVDRDESTMLEDVGWLIEYDIEIARLYLNLKGIDKPVTPEFIFDEGYCSWYGMSPKDLEENARVHRELKPLQKKDKLLYFNELKRMRLAQFAELKKMGWRKAQNI
ncbi:MAG: hypothetical protein PVG37_04910 [Desulfobacterales bacterium]|jgi:hypothetical protein